MIGSEHLPNPSLTYCTSNWKGAWKQIQLFRVQNGVLRLLHILCFQSLTVKTAPCFHIARDETITSIVHDFKWKLWEIMRNPLGHVGLVWCYQYSWFLHPFKILDQSSQEISSRFSELVPGLQQPKNSLWTSNPARDHSAYGQSQSICFNMLQFNSTYTYFSEHVTL